MQTILQQSCLLTSDPREGDTWGGATAVVCPHGLSVWAASASTLAGDCGRAKLPLRGDGARIVVGMVSALTRCMPG